MIRARITTNNLELAPDELELLNLIAELIAEIVIKETDKGDYDWDVKANN